MTPKFKKKTASPKRAPVPLGRPPRARAGEVEERVLQAARRVFLERGFGGASIDEIARISSASKPTIYARYPTKEALFAAVAARNAAHIGGRFGELSPEGATAEERLNDAGSRILERLLSDDVVNFMRMSAAEARRFPELVEIGARTRDNGARAVGQVLAKEAHSLELANLPCFAPDKLPETAAHFLDVVIARLLLRAILGEDPSRLRREIPEHVARGVEFFLAACRAKDR